MAALIDLAAKGRFKADEHIVFLHSGVAPSLFVYDDQFWAAWSEAGWR